MDVDHEVAARQVLHDEADVVAGLEAAVQVDQERVSGGVDHLEDPLLTHEAAEERNRFQVLQEVNLKMKRAVNTNRFKGENTSKVLNTLVSEFRGLL